MASTLFAALSLVLVSVVSAADDCSFSQLQKCQTDLNTYLNVDEPRPWEQPKAYRSKVEALFEKGGVDGLRKVCRGFREMKDCMQGCYRDVFSVPFLVLGDAQVRPDDAYTYMSIFNSFHYLCGAGLGTHLKNEVCMTKTWENHRGEMEKCRSDFEEMSAKEPIIACSLANTLLKCYERTFAAECGGTSRDTQFFGCEYMRVAIFSKYPQCPVACSLPVVG